MRGNRAPIRRLRTRPNRGTDQGGPGSRGHLIPWDGQGRHRCPLPRIGRPFVLEIKRPLRRNLPTKDLVDMVQTHASGKVEVDELSWCTRKKVNEVKQSRSKRHTRSDSGQKESMTRKKQRRQYSPFLDKSSIKRLPRGSLTGGLQRRGDGKSPRSTMSVSRGRDRANAKMRGRNIRQGTGPLGRG